MDSNRQDWFPRDLRGAVVRCQGARGLCVVLMGACMLCGWGGGGWRRYFWKNAFVARFWAFPTFFQKRFCLLYAEQLITMRMPLSRGKSIFLWINKYICTKKGEEVTVGLGWIVQPANPYWKLCSESFRVRLYLETELLGRQLRGSEVVRVALFPYVLVRGGNRHGQGLPWWSSGWDFAFQCWGVWLGELRSHMSRGQNTKRKTEAVL